MGKSNKSRSKKRSKQVAEAASTAGPSSDAEGQSSRETATLSPTPAAPESSPKPSNEGAETSQPVSHAETASEDAERPLLERLATGATIENVASAPSSPSDVNPSDENDAPGDAVAGHHAPSTGAQPEAPVAADDEQPREQGGGSEKPSREALMETWKIALEEAPSHGIPVHTFQPEWETALPSQADKGVEAEGGQGSSPQSSQEENQGGTRDIVDGEVQPHEVGNVGETIEQVKVDPKTGLHSKPEEVEKARLASVEQSPPVEKREADDDQRETWQVVTEYLQNLKSDQDMAKEANASQAEGEHAEKAMLANLQGQLELERQRNRELQLELENALQPSTGPGEQGLQPILVRRDLGRVQNLTAASADSGSPVTVIAAKHGKARTLLDKKKHLLEQDAPIYRTIESIVNYVDGVGDRPGREARREFEEFRDFTAQRVKALEAVADAADDDDDPLTTMQRFDERWSRTAFGTAWGTRLDLRVAAFKAVMYLRHAKGSPQYVSAVQNFEDQLAGLRERLSGSVDDPVVLQTQDILRSAAGKK